MTFRTPLDQNHHLMASFMAHERLGFAFPSFSLQRFSRFSPSPNSRDMTRKRKGGLMSPLARRALYSSALFRRASKELRIVSAITPADL
jgi:hypothetical protein